MPPKTPLAIGAPSPIFEDGNTELHRRIKMCKKLDEVAAFIASNRKQAAEMAKTYNNLQQLPIDLVHSLRLPRAIKEELRSLLIPITVTPGFKPLTELINLEAILKRYPAEPSSPLHYVITACAHIGNLIRQVIAYSYTHPSFNDLPEAEQDQISVLFSAMKTAMRKMPYYNQEEATMPPQLLATKLKNNALLAIRYQLATCGEMSEIAFLLLKVLYPDLSSSMMKIKHGDHRFLKVYFLLKDADGHYTAQHEIIFDPWSGNIFPAEFLWTAVKNFHFIQTKNKYSLNIVTHLNPKFHECMEYISFKKPIQKIEGDLPVSIKKLTRKGIEKIIENIAIEAFALHIYHHDWHPVVEESSLPSSPKGHEFTVTKKRKVQDELYSSGKLAASHGLLSHSKHGCVAMVENQEPILRVKM